MGEEDPWQKGEGGSGCVVCVAAAAVVRDVHR